MFLRQHIPGMTQPQIYLKVPGCWTGGHQENLSMRAVNINHGPGDVEWYFIDTPYVAKFRAAVKEEFDVDIHAAEGLWFINLEFCIKNNIRVGMFIQEAGDVVVQSPGVLHWVRSHEVALHSAWNCGEYSLKQQKWMDSRWNINLDINFRNLIPAQTCWLDLMNLGFKNFDDDCWNWLLKKMKWVIRKSEDEFDEFTNWKDSKKLRIQLNKDDPNNNMILVCSNCFHEIFNFWGYCESLREDGIFCWKCFKNHVEMSKKRDSDCLSDRHTAWRKYYKTDLYAMMDIAQKLGKWVDRKNYDGTVQNYSLTASEQYIFRDNYKTFSQVEGHLAPKRDPKTNKILGNDLNSNENNCNLHIKQDYDPAERKRQQIQNEISLGNKKKNLTKNIDDYSSQNASEKYFDTEEEKSSLSSNLDSDQEYDEKEDSDGEKLMVLDKKGNRKVLSKDRQKKPRKNATYNPEGKDSTTKSSNFTRSKKLLKTQNSDQVQQQNHKKIGLIRRKKNLCIDEDDIEPDTNYIGQCKNYDEALGKREFLSDDLETENTEKEKLCNKKKYSPQTYKFASETNLKTDKPEIKHPKKKMNVVKRLTNKINFNYIASKILPTDTVLEDDDFIMTIKKKNTIKEFDIIYDSKQKDGDRTNKLKPSNCYPLEFASPNSTERDLSPALSNPTADNEIETKASKKCKSENTNNEIDTNKTNALDLVKAQNNVQNKIDHNKNSHKKSNNDTEFQNYTLENQKKEKAQTYPKKLNDQVEYCVQENEPGTNIANTSSTKFQFCEYKDLAHDDSNWVIKGIFKSFHRDKGPRNIESKEGYREIWNCFLKSTKKGKFYSKSIGCSYNIDQVKLAFVGNMVKIAKDIFEEGKIYAIRNAELIFKSDDPNYLKGIKFTKHSEVVALDSNHDELTENPFDILKDQNFNNNNSKNKSDSSSENKT